MATWLFTQLSALFLVNEQNFLSALVLVPVLSVLNTGLFITAHDAMHGVVAPKDPRLNHWVGRIAMALYMGFPYERYRKAHGRHHAHPASAQDPDFHDGEHSQFHRWMLRFFWRNMSWQQVVVLHVLFWGLHLLAGVAIETLVVFWAIPAAGSALQLFYFGTYLPHRRPAGGYANRHNAQSNDYSELVSFLTCFHFGYHFEHHEYPTAPWWKLPYVRRIRNDARIPQVPRRVEASPN